MYDPGSSASVVYPGISKVAEDVNNGLSDRVSSAMPYPTTTRQVSKSREGPGRVLGECWRKGERGCAVLFGSIDLF